MPYKRPNKPYKRPWVSHGGAITKGRGAMPKFKRPKISGYIAPASVRSIAMRTNVRNQPIRNSRLRWTDTVFSDGGSAGYNALYNNPTGAKGHMLCNVMSTGSGNGQRDGNTIFNRSLILNLALRNNDVNVLQGASVRFIVFNDRKPNAVLTGVDAHISNLLTTASTTGRLMSPIKPDALDRYKVLHDEVYNMQPAGSCGSKLTTKLTIPLNFKSIFNGPIVTDESAMTEGALYVLWFLEEPGNGGIGALPAEAPFGTVHARVYYMP